METSSSNRSAFGSWLLCLLGVTLVVAMGLGHGSGWGRGVQRSGMEKRLAEQLPALGARSSYTSSQTCLSCHPDQHHSWMTTYHRTMTMRALPETVLGDFNGQTVLSDGLAYTVSRTNDTFWARMPDPDLVMQAVQGKKGGDLTRIPSVDLQVVMTTGSHHYQTYWVESPRLEGLMQTLPLVYLIEDQRWIPREAAFMRGPDDQERLVTQWNHHCIRCHSTGWNPGLDDRSGMLNTEVAELGISCEACHGPGKEHIAYHRNPFNRYARHLGSEPTHASDLVNPAKLDHQLSSHVCGQCHGVFMPNNDSAMDVAHKGVQFRPGENLHDKRYYIQYPKDPDDKERWADLQANPQFFAERWWEDGTVLAGGREFTAMSASGCYTRGKMSCLSCHSMHQAPPEDQLTPQSDANASCTQCHQEAEYNERIESHTFHSGESSGSECMNCHMPHTTYALFNAIRSHQIASPQVASSLEHGVPNACNLCHLDQTLAWTQSHLVDRYGHEALEMPIEHRETAASILWTLKGHAAQRAVGAWHMGWDVAQKTSGGDWLSPYLAILLNDPYPVVRYIAKRSLESVMGEKVPDYDFMGDSSDRQRTYQEIMAHYASNVSQRGGDEKLLLDDAGQIDQRTYRRLLRQRDDRPITIKE